MRPGRRVACYSARRAGEVVVPGAGAARSAVATVCPSGRRRPSAPRAAPASRRRGTSDPASLAHEREIALELRVAEAAVAEQRRDERDLRELLVEIRALRGDRLLDLDRGRGGAPRAARRRRPTSRRARWRARARPRTRSRRSRDRSPARAPRGRRAAADSRAHARRTPSRARPRRSRSGSRASVMRRPSGERSQFEGRRRVLRVVNLLEPASHSLLERRPAPLGEHRLLHHGGLRSGHPLQIGSQRGAYHRVERAELRLESREPEDLPHLAGRGGVLTGDRGRGEQQGGRAKRGRRGAYRPVRPAGRSS